MQDDLIELHHQGPFQASVSLPCAEVPADMIGNHPRPGSPSTKRQTRPGFARGTAPRSDEPPGRSLHQVRGIRPTLQSPADLNAGQKQQVRMIARQQPAQGGAIAVLGTEQQVVGVVTHGCSYSNAQGCRKPPPLWEFWQNLAKTAESRRFLPLLVTVLKGRFLSPLSHGVSRCQSADATLILPRSLTPLVRTSTLNGLV